MYIVRSDIKIISRMHSVPAKEYYEKNVFDLFPKLRHYTFDATLGLTEFAISYFYVLHVRLI